ncbi:hypothetical protein LJR153_007106 [Paenibacillus sp. LjRoot153]|uniref:hypothetical protein n=1 Tax=Paenibacillus sp. LjRoot153 TaxID=3342270 RepID=UPI003ECEF459
MKKKIEKVIEKEGPLLIVQEQILRMKGLNSDQIEEQIINEMDIRTGKLIHLYTSDLREAVLELEREETDLDKKFLQMQKNNQPIEQIDLDHLRLLNMNVRILNNAMAKKKMAIKRNTNHPLENTLVQYPFVSSSYPSESKLETMKKEGVLLQYRNGYHRLSYRNERGKLLSTFDELTLLGLGSLWQKNGRFQEIPFDFKELAAEMYIIEPSGGDYTNILNSLKNLYATSFVTETFLDEQGLIREGIEYEHIFSKFVLHGKEGRERAGTIKFADVIHDNLMAGKYVNVNLLVLNDFENNATKALYPFILSILQSYYERYVLEMDKLIQHCNISDDNPSKARTIVMRAFEEFAAYEVISEPKLQKLGDQYFVYFYPAQSREPTLIESENVKGDQL